MELQRSERALRWQGGSRALCVAGYSNAQCLWTFSSMGARRPSLNSDRSLAKPCGWWRPSHCSHLPPAPSGDTPQPSPHASGWTPWSRFSARAPTCGLRPCATRPPTPLWQWRVNANPQPRAMRVGRGWELPRAPHGHGAPTTPRGPARPRQPLPQGGLGHGSRQVGERWAPRARGGGSASRGGGKGLAAPRWRGRLLPRRSPVWAQPAGGTVGAGLRIPAGGGDGFAGDTAPPVLALPREWPPGSKMESVSRAGQEISLAALKQHDPYITSIADVTGQVALYSFSPKANEWVSPEERGSLSPRPGRAGPGGGGGGGAAPGRAFAFAAGSGRGSGRPRPSSRLARGLRPGLLSAGEMFRVWVPSPHRGAGPEGRLCRGRGVERRGGEDRILVAVAGWTLF